MKVRCSNCRKKFDYENFYGLCPKCGAYNAKTTYEEKVVDGKAQRDGGSIFVKVVTLVTVGVVLLSLLGAFSFQQRRKAIPDTKEVEILSAFAGEQLTFADYTYNVGDAVVVTDATKDKRLPKDTKLVAVYLFMVYTGKHDEYENRFMPYVYDKTKYVPVAEQFELSEIAEEYGMPGENLNSYNIYAASNRVYEGYVLYLIDQSCEEMTLNLECRLNTLLKRIYEVPLTLYEYEELNDGFYEDDGEEFWDDDLFYDFDDYYNWFDYFDDDYEEYGEDDDYGIQDMRIKGNLNWQRDCGGI